MKLITSPLEQFQILPIVPINVGGFDFSLTNSTVIVAVGLFCFCFILNSLVNDRGSYNLVPSRWQIIIEEIYQLVVGLLKDTVGTKGREFFPYIFALFSFILVANLIGLIPYSFTVTSHIIVTFSLAIGTFIGINLICVRAHGSLFLTLFLPQGSSLPLAFILVPIELVSYFVRPISLSARLFANMMAGHTLLKVIAGFAWTMMLSGGVLLIVHFVPLLILVVVMGLELGVALIQAYVFTILTCMYLNDALHLH
jgi:ATP synthase subunit 6